MQDDYQQIVDYLSEELNEKEKAEFEDSLKENVEKQKLFKQITQKYHAVLWSEWWTTLNEQEAYAHLCKRLQKRKWRIRMIRYAAIFFLLLTGGVIFQTRQTQQTPPLAFSANTSKTFAKSPVLTLNNGKQFALRDSSLAHLEIQEKTNIRLTHGGGLEYIPLPHSETKETAYNTLTIPHSCEFTVTLSDSSQIWLNAGSELKYPEVFPDDVREIYLSGEAYFEVVSDPSRPFYVRTQEMKLKVLGTCFNIKAYPEETETVTTLISGSIEQHFSPSGQKLRLLPSQQSRFDHNTGDLQIHHADTDEVLAWKNGKFIARDKSLEEIFRQLSRWYDFETVYTHPSLKTERFHVHTNRYATIREILDHLQSTNGIRFSYVDNKIYVSR